ncbi:MAG: hypothetical protein R3Y26_08645 [Rikenellaceae bacterium]
MDTKVIYVIVEYHENGMSAYIDGAPIFTVGNDFKEIKDNISEAIELYLEDNPTPLDMFIGDYVLVLRIYADTPIQ